MRKISTGLKLAIKAAGTEADLARKLHITPQAINKWADIPLERVLQVERATGVPREKLAPQMYERLT
jgi:DNA-binding transcriptional regulator YdaS (Cro superfamily)